MTIPVSALEVGKCYLTLPGEVRRFLRILREGKLHYEAREATVLRAIGWKEGVLETTPFAALLEREVACDWTPET
jgi:hypothetical protein